MMLLLSILILTLPFTKEVFEYKWTPSKDGLEARLTLINFEPDFFELRVPCELVTSTNDWIFEAKGGKALRISIFENRIDVLLGSKISDKIFPYYFNLNEIKECEFVYLSFKENTRDLSLRADDVLVQSSLIDKDARFELASYVVWNPLVSRSNVEVSLNTSSNLFLKKSLFREVIDRVVFLIIIIWVFINLINYIRKIEKVKYRFRFDRYDFLSLSFLTFLIFGLHTILDDGMYLIETQVLRQTNVFTQYLYPVPFPVGDWHFKITSIFLGDNPNFAALRIIPAISLFLIWKIFCMNWLNFQGSEKKADYLKLFTWAIWAFFAATFLLSLRPEVYVSLIMLLCLVIVRDYFFGNKITSLYLSISLTMIALSLHQTGIVVFFLMAPAWLHFIFINKLRGISLRKFSLHFLLGVYILFVNSNVNLLLSKVRDFEAVNDWPLPFHETLSWNDPPWAEWKRIEHTFLADSLRFTAGLIVVFTIILLTVFLKRKHLQLLNSEKLFLGSIVIGSAGLAFAPSKWVDHYGALLPLVLVSFVFLYNNKNKNYFLSATVFISSLTIIALNKSWVAGGKNIYTIDLNNRVINTIYYLATDKYFLLVISLLLSTTLIVIFIISYFKSKFDLILIFSVSMLAALVVRQTTPTIVDAAIGTDGWAMNRQIAASLTKSDYLCGVFSKESLVSLNIDQDAKFAFATPQDYVIYPCLRPTPIESGIWIFPDYSVGNLHRWDQQRLMNRMNAETIYCFDSSPRISSNNFDACIYKWTSEIPQMRLVSS